MRITGSIRCHGRVVTAAPQGSYTFKITQTKRSHTSHSYLILMSQKLEQETDHSQVLETIVNSFKMFEYNDEM
jgi:hypothetical protein